MPGWSSEFFFLPLPGGGPSFLDPSASVVAVLDAEVGHHQAQQGEHQHQQDPVQVRHLAALKV